MMPAPVMKKLLTLSALATCCGHVMAADQKGGPDFFSQALQIIFALLFVIGLIFFLAMLVNKHNLVPVKTRQVIEVMATTTLGGNDKLLLVQIGADQILLGQTKAGLRKLHGLSENIEVPKELLQTGGGHFQHYLDRYFGKDNKAGGDSNA